MILSILGEGGCRLPSFSHPVLHIQRVFNNHLCILLVSEEMKAQNYGWSLDSLQVSWHNQVWGVMDDNEIILTCFPVWISKIQAPWLLQTLVNLKSPEEMDLIRRLYRLDV